jgi:ABC-2 type transport system permease protein
VLISYAAHQLGLGLLPVAGLTVLSLTLGLALHWAVFFGVSTLGFWFVKLHHLIYVGVMVVDLARLPTTAYGSGLSAAFTFLIPLAIVAYIPAQLALGDNVWHLVVIAAIVIMMLVALSRAFFFFALRSYSSASG